MISDSWCPTILLMIVATESPHYNRERHVLTKWLFGKVVKWRLEAHLFNAYILQSHLVKYAYGEIWTHIHGLVNTWHTSNVLPQHREYCYEHIFVPFDILTAFLLSERNTHFSVTDRPPTLFSMVTFYNAMPSFSYLEL